MNTKDLEIFLALAQLPNMQAIAAKLDKSPSMLSKSLKRLEHELSAPLFDRQGKHIVLNKTGQHFVRHASNIVAQAKFAQLQCSATGQGQSFSIAAPAIALFRWASVIAKYLTNEKPHVQVDFQVCYEQKALAQLIAGHVDIALITSSLAAQIPEHLHYVSLGTLTMKVAAARNHPLVKQYQTPNAASVIISNEHLKKYPFVGPDTSPYCGEQRGIGCDGWNDEKFPRVFSSTCNDYAVISQLVKSGQVLAYLPEHWLHQLSLVPIEIFDFDNNHLENILLVSQLPDICHGFTA